MNNDDLEKNVRAVFFNNLKARDLLNGLKNKVNEDEVDQVMYR